MHRRRDTLSLATALVLMVSSCRLGAAFSTGDYVPVARRAQFHSQRTHWHDVLARHCPRFGIDDAVFLPLPKPHGFDVEHDTYKLAIAFDGDRFQTQWLSVAGNMVRTVPLLDVELRRAGGDLTGIKAKLYKFPEQDMARYQNVIEHHLNASHWPKHLLVRYHWSPDQDSASAADGLFVLLLTTLIASSGILLSVLFSSRRQIERYDDDPWSRFVRLDDRTGGVACFPLELEARQE